MNHTNLPALFHAEAAKNSQSALRISVSSQEMDRKMIFRLKRKEKKKVMWYERKTVKVNPLPLTITPSPDYTMTFTYTLSPFL